MPSPAQSLGSCAHSQFPKPKFLLRLAEDARFHIENDNALEVGFGGGNQIGHSRAAVAVFASLYQLVLPLRKLSLSHLQLDTWKVLGAAASELGCVGLGLV